MSKRFPTSRQRPRPMPFYCMVHKALQHDMTKEPSTTGSSRLGTKTPCKLGQANAQPNSYLLWLALLTKLKQTVSCWSNTLLVMCLYAVAARQIFIADITYPCYVMHFISGRHTCISLIDRTNKKQSKSEADHQKAWNKVKCIWIKSIGALHHLHTLPLPLTQSPQPRWRPGGLQHRQLI